MATPAPCACTCVNTDSALSVTSSAISIITLAYVLLIGVGYRVATYQRDKDRSSGLHADATALRHQLDNIIALNNSKPEKDDPILNKLLQDASEQLGALERHLTKGAKTSDDWYLIWRQVQHSRKREEWRQDLNKIKAQMELYLNYQTLSSMVQERNDAEDPANHRLRKKMRNIIVQQAQEMTDVSLPRRSGPEGQDIFERTYSQSGSDVSESSAN